MQYNITIFYTTQLYLIQYNIAIFNTIQYSCIAYNTNAYDAMYALDSLQCRPL